MNRIILCPKCNAKVIEIKWCDESTNYDTNSQTSQGGSKSPGNDDSNRIHIPSSNPDLKLATSEKDKEQSELGGEKNE